ncbi:MAG: murein biosynthesis integral membrane protein MurJ [Verrucomicrobia bacterium]|nr:murein biosynthesis integral membrane protein MurJ [Verrucomicrobiota bacterium]
MTVEQSTAVNLGDSISSIKRSALRFLSGTALSRVTGMLRDIVLAYCFGTHEALAALFVAFRLSHICRRLFGEGALQSAFIPVFEDLRKEEPERAFRFFRDLSYLLVLFLLGFIGCSMLGLGASMQLFDWSAGNREIHKLMIILMPSLLFICLFGLNSSLLQCQKRYFTVGIAPAFFNLIVCAGGLLFHTDSLDPVAAMPYVALSLVLGCMAQWAVTFLPVLRTLRAALTSGLRDSIKIFSKDVRRLGGPLALGLLGVGASQINNAVDALFARWADPQGPAQLWYSLRLLQLPLALFGIAISGALLPPLSRSIQAGKKEEYLRFLDFALRRVFALLAPCSIALYVLGTPLINCLYGHGDFQLHSIITTCGCLHGYAMGLLPMGLIIVLAPAFYAYKDFKRPAIAAFIALVINLALNVLFVFGWGMQALSVALATSISSWINVIYLYKRLQGHFGPVNSPEGKKELGKGLLLCIFAGVLTWFFQDLCTTTPSFFHFFTVEQTALPSCMIDQIVALAIPGCFFLVALLSLSWLFKANDLLVLFRLKKEVGA